jgi:hypothetical protein
MSSDPHGTFERRRIYEFMVESLVFAFDYLALHGYKPVATDGDFYIGDHEGKELPPSAADAMAQVMTHIEDIAPAAVRALEKRGTPGDEGTVSSAAVLEAFDQWTKRQGPQVIMEGDQE